MLSFAPPTLSTLRPLNLSALLDLLSAIKAGETPTPVAVPESTANINPLREHAVTAIMEFNPGASRCYLDQFSDRAIERYHKHLEASRLPRGGGTGWVRETNEPTIAVMAA